MHVFLGYPFKLGAGYRERLRAICRKRALDLRTPEDHFDAAGIWDDIQDDIDQSLYSIFDLTDYNHNVLLELGFALGRDRDVVILINVPPHKPGMFTKPVDPLSEYPSDLASIRRIQYADMHDLERKLLETFDNLLTRKHPDEQFWMLLRSFLKDGSQDTKSISTFMEGKLEFSYQMTRNRLQRRFKAGDLTKKVIGRTSVYGLN